MKSFGGGTTVRAGFFVAALVSVHPASANLLVNGSFEAPSIPSGTFQSFSNNESIGPGWIAASPETHTLVSGAVSGYLTAQDGIQSLRVGQDGIPNVRVYQAVTLFQDVDYRLSFYLSGLNGNEAAVSAGIVGNSGATFSANAPADSQWYAQSIDFTPLTGGTYFVVFDSYNFDPAVIDNVSLDQITPVPEPGACGLISGSLALAAVACVRRKRARV